MAKTSCKRGTQGFGRKFFVLGAILLISSSISWAHLQDAKFHRKGKEYIRERDWEKAILVYERLLQEYPRSLYCDDARFWIGFCLEQMPGHDKKAFNSYQQLIDAYPQSPWADDAVIHQIFLAKKLHQQGEDGFLNFLRLKINESNQPIRYQAAIALGELKDQNALTIIEEMAKGEDQALAKQAMDVLEGYSESLEDRVENDLGEFENEPVSLKEGMSDGLREKLGKSGGGWTDEQLWMNGLYHIVPKEELAFYLSLKSEWDRKEWWRKFWAMRDPTPITEENEAEEAFKQRVLTARKHFGKDWNSRDDYYPPWDSRGELYIKLGNPDRREDAEEGWEVWTYYKQKVNFLVSNQRSNINGKGLYLGTTSRYLYRNSLRRSSTYYIQKPRFIYIHTPYLTIKRIQNFDLRITSANPAELAYRIRFTFQFPASNLRYQKNKDQIDGAYRYQWVVFDEDYHRVSSSDSIQELTFDDNDSLKDAKVFGNFHVALAPGLYALALKIEDTRSNVMGTYRKKFTIRSKGGIQEMENEENDSFLTTGTIQY